MSFDSQKFMMRKVQRLESLLADAEQERDQWEERCIYLENEMEQQNEMHENAAITIYSDGLTKRHVETDLKHMLAVFGLPIPTDERDLESLSTHVLSLMKGYALAQEQERTKITRLLEKALLEVV